MEGTFSDKMNGDTYEDCGQIFRVIWLVLTLYCETHKNSKRLNRKHVPCLILYS